MVLSWYKVFTNNLESLPPSAGVYILSVLLKNGDYAVIYVGQSNNIKDRVKEHFSNSEQNIDLKRYLQNNYTFKVSYANLEKQYLDGVEKYLIYKYSPRFNDQEGNGNIQYQCNTPNVIKFPI